MFSILSLFTSSLLASTALAWPSALPAPFVQNTTVFIPPANWPDKGGSYARSVLLNQDCEQGTPTILATAAYNAPDGQYFLIHKPPGRISPRRTSMAMPASPVGLYFSPSCMNWLNRLESISLELFCCLVIVFLGTFRVPTSSCMPVRTKGKFFTKKLVVPV
jgi:hypothetical protein